MLSQPPVDVELYPVKMEAAESGSEKGNSCEHDGDRDRLAGGAARRYIAPDSACRADRAVQAVTERHMPGCRDRDAARDDAHASGGEEDGRALHFAARRIAAWCAACTSSAVRFVCGW